MENNIDNKQLEEGQQGGQQNEPQTENKTYTAEEVQQLLQSEADRRVQQALATQQKKFEKQLSLSKLDGAEREKAERDQRIAELEEQLREFTVEKNKSELKSVLSARGLSAEFADIVNISDNLEEAQANIEKLDKLFKDAVKNEVEKRLAGNTPKKGADVSTKLTKETARKMTIAEMNELAEKDPALFKELFS